MDRDRQNERLMPTGVLTHLDKCHHNRGDTVRCVKSTVEASVSTGASANMSSITATSCMDVALAQNCRTATAAGRGRAQRPPCSAGRRRANAPDVMKDRKAPTTFTSFLRTAATSPSVPAGTL